MLKVYIFSEVTPIRYRTCYRCGKKHAIFPASHCPKCCAESPRAKKKAAKAVMHHFGVYEKGWI